MRRGILCVLLSISIASAPQATAAISSESGVPTIDQAMLNAKFQGMLELGLTPSPAAFGQPVSRSQLSAAAASTVTSYSRTLNVIQHAQSATNWCGPAAGLAVLRYLGRNTSALYPYPSLSESALAGSQYMNSGSAGSTAGTDWADLDMSHGLNTWIGSSIYFEFVPTSIANLWDYVGRDISAGLPVPADLVELGNGPFYNNHPPTATGSTRYHWLTIYGMTGASALAGTVLKFADSGGGSASLVAQNNGWINVNPYFQLSTSASYSRMVQVDGYRGIVW
jgi:hypothetical protein